MRRVVGRRVSRRSAELCRDVERSVVATAVEQHAFFQLWVTGELTSREVYLYAREGAQPVRGLVASAHRAYQLAPAHLTPSLASYVMEWDGRGRDWERFLVTARWGARRESGDAESLPLTRVCANLWRGTSASTLGEHLAILYAAEVAQALIAQLVLPGLVSHHRIASGPAVSYFSSVVLSESRNLALLEWALTAGLDCEQPQRLLEAARAASSAYLGLLDGIEASARIRPWAWASLEQ